MCVQLTWTTQEIQLKHLNSVYEIIFIPTGRDRDPVPEIRIRPFLVEGFTIQDHQMFLKMTVTLLKSYC